MTPPRTKGMLGAMLARLARRITDAAAWPRVGVVLLVYIGFIAALTAAENRIKLHSGGLGPPDLMHFFTADELYARLDAFGEEGRSLYFKAELIDLVYPLVYSSLFALLIALGMKRISAAESRARLLCLVPVVALVFDYLENTTLFTVLLAWPARLSAVASAGGLFNGGKWVFFALSLATAALSLLASLVQWIRSR